MSNFAQLTSPYVLGRFFILSLAIARADGDAAGRLGSVGLWRKRRSIFDATVEGDGLRYDLIRSCWNFGSSTFAPKGFPHIVGRLVTGCVSRRSASLGMRTEYRNVGSARPEEQRDSDSRSANYISRCGEYLSCCA